MKFKRFFACLCALSMCFTTIGFASCSDEKTPDADLPKEEEPVDPDTPVDPDPVAPEDPDTPTEEQTISDFIKKLRNVGDKTIKAQVGVEESFQTTVSGETFTYKNSLGFDSYFNVKGENVKLDLELNSFDGKTTYSELYAFAREGYYYIYNTDDRTKKTEWTKDDTLERISASEANEALFSVILDYLGNSDDTTEGGMMISIADLIDSLDSMGLISTADISNGKIMSSVADLLDILDKMGMLTMKTVDDGTVISADLMGGVNTFVSDYKTFAESLSLKTTLNEIYSNATLKKYLVPVLSKISAYDIYSMIVENLGSLITYDQTLPSDDIFAPLLALIPIPSEGEDLYVYIGKLLSTSIPLDSSGAITVEPGKMNLGYVLSMAGSTVTEADLKAATSNSVKELEEAVKTAFGPLNGLTLSLSFDKKGNFSLLEINAALNPEYIGVESQSFEVYIKISTAENYAFADISKCTVVDIVLPGDEETPPEENLLAAA